MKIRVISIRSPKRRLQMAQTLHISPDAFPTVPFLIKLTVLTENKYKQILVQCENQHSVMHSKAENALYFAPENPVHMIKIRELLQVSDDSWGVINKVYSEFFSGKQTKWEWKNQSIDFSKGPFIMGVLNVTPDSFSDGGQYIARERAVEHALAMVEDGADIIDVGGESTRPGSDPVSAANEQERILPVIEQVRKYSKVKISVDTYKSVVAKSALEAGAVMVNDISAGSFDPLMSKLVLNSGVPFIIMHMQGEPRNMQQNPEYQDATDEIYDYFARRTSELINQGHKMLIIDPGIGFGKRLHDNLELIRHLDDFMFLGFPVMIGTSRKSFIGKILDRDVNHRLAGTLSTVQTSIENGADIIRVHDVRQVRELFTIHNAVEDPQKRMD